MPPSVKVAIFFLIGVYDVCLLTVLFRLVQFRHNAFITLAQGPLLVAMLLAALIGGTFTFTFLPEKNLYCSLQGPLVQLPATLVSAILVARMWRVHVTLSGAMQLGSSTGVGRKEKGFCLRSVLERIVAVLSFFAKLSIIPKICTAGKKSSSRGNQASARFRQTATSAETAQLVVFLVMPQAVLQIVGNVLVRPSLEMAVDEVGATYFFCEDSWISSVGGFLHLVMLVLVMNLTWVGRDLPSVFNEADANFRIAILWLIITLAITNIQFQLTTNQKNKNLTGPMALLSCIRSLAYFSLTPLLLVYPKIVRARRGEKVIVGNLLRACGSELSFTPKSNVLIAGEPIILKKDDPVPQDIETQIHRLHIMFKRVVDGCASGGVLLKAEWNQVKRSVAKLKTDLDRVTLAWDESSDNHSSLIEISPNGVSLIDISPDGSDGKSSDTSINNVPLEQCPTAP